MTDSVRAIKTNIFSVAPHKQKSRVATFFVFPFIGKRDIVFCAADEKESALYSSPDNFDAHRGKGSSFEFRANMV